MEIKDQLVASIHYALKDDEGTVIDSSTGQEPLHYIHGAQNIVPGLEKELTGKKVGDKLQVVVQPEEGYGEYDASLIQAVPRTMFSGAEDIKVGMEFHAQTQQGMQVVEVVEIEEESITINGNHPLAGKTLHFDIEITAVREATADELERGHLHEPSGSH